MMKNSHLIEKKIDQSVSNKNSYKCENKHESSLYLENQPVCPCCSYILLRHISLDGVYWYCSHCHQKMPPAHY